MVVGLAGDIRVHVPVELEAARNPDLDEAVERPEHGCTAERRLVGTHPVVHLAGGELAAGTIERVGNKEALRRHALASRCEAGRGGIGHGSTVA